MSKTGKILLGVGGVALLGGLIVISASAKRERGTAVRFERVNRRDLVAAVTASGKVQPKTKVDVSPDITGRITRLAAHEGDLVTKGQFLLQIDPTIYEAGLQRAEALHASAQAALVQARASRDQAARALQRAKQLKRQNPNLISDEQLEQAQTSYNVAEAVANSSQHQVDQARAGMQEARDQLAKTRIVAPMSGRITRLAVEEGEMAVPGNFSRDVGLLLTVSDLSVIQTKVNVDETDVVRIHLGDSVEVSIDAFPDTTFVGRVTKIANSALLTQTIATGSGDRAVDYEVEITLENPPSDVRPDLSATARIVTDTRARALSIPIIALTVRENAPVTPESQRDTARVGQKKETEGVFVVLNGKATFRPVRVGIAGDEYFEVLDGLRENEQIVAGPYQAIRDLKDGTPVRQTQLASDSAKRSGS
jgi:HlyD family secretion protein